MPMAMDLEVSGVIVGPPSPEADAPSSSLRSGRPAHRLRADAAPNDRTREIARRGRRRPIDEPPMLMVR